MWFAANTRPAKKGKRSRSEGGKRGGKERGERKRSSLREPAKVLLLLIISLTPLSVPLATTTTKSTTLQLFGTVVRQNTGAKVLTDEWAMG